MKRQSTTVPLTSQTIAILGYGNQGRAHALNLRDSGFRVVVGGREGGRGIAAARADGFEAEESLKTAQGADIVMLMQTDTAIGPEHDRLRPVLTERASAVGLCHGYAYHFGLFRPIPDLPYFLVGPKAAGFVLRDRFEKKQLTPGVVAVSGAEAWPLAKAYAAGIGCAPLHETTFQEETECDLFGEQSVLCGGLLELMRAAYLTLQRRGHSKEMSFYECCYEARLILDLFLKFGPREMLNRISPTAAYGGITRGARVLHPDLPRVLDEIFDEIRSGEFTREWSAEVAAGAPTLGAAKARAGEDPLEAGFRAMAGKY